jgi:hypothetical protein
MQQIPIWKGNHHHREFTGLVAIVDDEDFKKVNKWFWTLAGGYPRANIKVNGKWTKVNLHHYILPPKDGFLVDHEDRMPLNAQKKNLRYCTKAQNSWNRPKDKRTNAKSKYKGVQWKPNNRAKPEQGRWMSRLSADNYNYHLGYHDTEHQAALMYDFWATLIHGDFAVTNFPIVSSSEKPIGGSNGQIPTVERNSVPGTLPSVGNRR